MKESVYIMHLRRWCKNKKFPGLITLGKYLGIYLGIYLKKIWKKKMFCFAEAKKIATFKQN